LDELRGFEGAATRELFEALRELVPPLFGFQGRNRRPPLDPVNALLSFSYSLLAAHAATTLFRAGLLPWLGLYHDSRGSHPALASDIVEEFRYLVELLVLRLVRKRQVNPADFSAMPDGSVRMSAEARVLVVREFEEVLCREVTEERQGLKTTYRDLIARQAKRIVSHVVDGTPYVPWSPR
jgi:CRISPR-associated protein Cas1